jgi:protein-L-isoaspartate O-methyltransferase
VLDVGSGSGYLTAVFHHLVSSEGKTGKVVGIDHIPELVQFSVENLKKDGLGKALEDGQIEMVISDGRQGDCTTLCVMGPADVLIIIRLYQLRLVIKVISFIPVI